MTTAPFGSPVVPLVYMIAKGSSAPGPSPGGSAEAPSNADSYSSPKHSRQPGAGASAYSGPSTMPLTSACASSAARSSSSSRKLSGTAIAPRLASAQ